MVLPLLGSIWVFLIFMKKLERRCSARNVIDDPYDCGGNHLDVIAACGDKLVGWIAIIAHHSDTVVRYLVLPPEMQIAYSKKVFEFGNPYPPEWKTDSECYGPSS